MSGQVTGVEVRSLRVEVRSLRAEVRLLRVEVRSLRAEVRSMNGWKTLTGGAGRTEGGGEAAQRQVAQVMGRRQFQHVDGTEMWTRLRDVMWRCGAQGARRIKQSANFFIFCTTQLAQRVGSKQSLELISSSQEELTQGPDQTTCLAQPH